MIIMINISLACIVNKKKFEFTNIRFFSGKSDILSKRIKWAIKFRNRVQKSFMSAAGNQKTSRKGKRYRTLNLVGSDWSIVSTLQRAGDKSRGSLLESRMRRSHISQKLEQSTLVQLQELQSCFRSQIERQLPKGCRDAHWSLCLTALSPHVRANGLSTIDGGRSLFSLPLHKLLKVRI